MPKYKCTKCKKKFDCRSALEKHYQRKTPCDQEDQFTCFRCKKVFNVKLNYERHINKKIPCQDNNQSESSSVSSEKIALQREKIKLKEKLAENEMEKLRMKNEQKEKDRLAEIEKIRLQTEQIKLKEEMKTEREIEIQKLKNEKVHLQKEKAIVVENEKTERKERTTTIINKDHAMININNVTNNINNTYMYDFNIDEEKKEKFKKRILDSIDEQYAKKVINRMEGMNDMISFCIASNFNNDNYPELKYYKYDEENKIYFKFDETSTSFKPTEFEDIAPEFRIAFEKMSKKILTLAPEPRYGGNEKNYGNYAEIRNCTYKGTYNMINAEGIGLLEENKIPDVDEEENEEIKPEYW